MAIEKGKPRPILIRNPLFTALLFTGVLFLIAILILQAQNNLGVMYQHGLGVPQDYTEAVKWYRRAAEWGYADAQSNLGNMYYQGRGVPQDYAEAVKWYRKAAEQGYPTAQAVLAGMYMSGRGVPINYAEALKWLEKGTTEGNLACENCLAWLLATCPDDQIRDGERALHCQERCCEGCISRKPGYTRGGVIQSDAGPTRDDAGTPAEPSQRGVERSLARGRKRSCLNPPFRRCITLNHTPLAAAYAELGRFDDAIRTQEEAITKLKKDGNESDEINNYRERLQAYRDRSPWRENPK